jgi:hypoxanthine phosphoribosyltransferase
MFYLAMIPGLAFAAAVGITLYSNRTDIYAFARNVHNNLVFANGDRDELVRALSEIESEDARIAQEAIPGLVGYARKLNPDWIAGVNPGGRMIASRLCKEIGLGADRCFYVKYDTETGNLALKSGARLISGTLLVIDDISRTGNTLQSVKAFLYENNGIGPLQLQAVRFGVLVVDATPDEEHTDFAPDWACFKTTAGGNFRFAWTAMSDAIKADCKRKRLEREQKNAGTVARPRQPAVLENYEEERLAKDMDYAASQLEKYIG